LAAGERVRTEAVAGASAGGGGLTAVWGDAMAAACCEGLITNAKRTGTNYFATSDPGRVKSTHAHCSTGRCTCCCCWHGCRAECVCLRCGGARPPPGRAVGVGRGAPPPPLFASNARLSQRDKKLPRLNHRVSPLVAS
jgi:hypothetical protein